MQNIMHRNFGLSHYFALFVAGFVFYHYFWEHSN